MSLISNKKRYLNSASLVYFCFLGSHVQAQTQTQDPFNRHIHELTACNSNSSNCYEPLTIVNDRSEPVWISVIQSDLVLWHKKEIKPGQTVPFLKLPRNGISSLTFKVATGCDESGNNCLTGEVRGGLYDGRDPSKVFYDLKVDENGKETGDRIYRSAMFKDPPPSEHVNSVDFVTKAEFTFGCFNGNRQECNKTPQNNFLPAYTNFNLSAVDGFNVPLKIVVTRSSSEPQNENDCPVLLDASHLSIKNCPMFRGHSLSVFTPDDLKKGDTSHPIGCYSLNKLITTAKIFGGLEQKETDDMNYQYSCHKVFNQIPEGEKEDLAVIQCRYVYQGSDRKIKREEALKLHNQAHPNYWGHGKDWTESVQRDKAGRQHTIYSFAYDDIAALKQCNSIDTKYELHILDESQEVVAPPPVVTPPIPPISPESPVVTPPPTEPGVTPPTGVAPTTTVEHTQSKIKICTPKYGGTGFVDLHYSFVKADSSSSPQMNVRMNDHPTDPKQSCYEVSKPAEWKDATLKYHFTKINAQGVGDTQVVYGESKPTASGTPSVPASPSFPAGAKATETAGIFIKEKPDGSLAFCVDNEELKGGIVDLHYQLDSNPPQHVRMGDAETFGTVTYTRCRTIPKQNASNALGINGNKTITYSFTKISAVGVGQPETSKRTYDLAPASTAMPQWESDAQIPGLMVLHDKTAKKLKLCMRHDGTLQTIVVHYNFVAGSNQLKEQDNRNLDLVNTESINGIKHACFTIDQNNLSPVFNSVLDKSTVYYSFTTITTRGAGADSKWSSRVLK